MRKKTPEEMVAMGRVAAPYGVQGWIKIEPYTETPDSLTRYAAWWVCDEDEWREIAVAEAKPQGKIIVAKLAGVEDRTAAQGLKGALIAVKRSDLPPAGNGEYYWADLINLQVVNLAGEELGTVTSLLATGANDVMQVMGERERLIPFISQVVREVDLQHGVIRVDWGLDY
ncbi:MAG: ribosome maturation factor RimM [Burkholderiales bacterium]